MSVAIGAIPNLIITAGQQYDMLVPAQLTIFAQASVALCPGDKAGTTALIYEWTCSREDAVSTSVDPRYFKIDPFGFNSTQSYQLQVVVTDRLGLNNTATTKIVVGQSPLVAAIDGGDRIVGVSEGLTLDASPSADPDAPDDASGLLFALELRGGRPRDALRGRRVRGQPHGRQRADHQRSAPRTSARSSTRSSSRRSTAASGATRRRPRRSR